MIVYVDYNATAPVRPEAQAAMIEATGGPGNASSVHAAGRRTRAMIMAARSQVAALARAEPHDVVFTSGGTEAIDLAINGLRPDRIILSAIEHDCVRAAAAASHADVDSVPVDGTGLIDLAALERALASRKPAPDGGGRVLVALMAVNNETGVVQPVRAAAQLAAASGALFLCDAVQAVGKVDVAAFAESCAMLVFSAHKTGGPQGAGALVVRDGLDLIPQLRGGGQELGRRAGTENGPGIAGFGAALRAVMAARDEPARLRAMRDRLEAALLAAVPDAVIAGQAAQRAPNTTCIALPGVPAETQVMAMDLAGVAVSAGSACSSGKVQRSHVLDAMGYPPEIAGSAIRISIGWATTGADIDRCVEAWTDMAARLYRQRPPASGVPASGSRGALIDRTGPADARAQSSLNRPAPRAMS